MAFPVSPVDGEVYADDEAKILRENMNAIISGNGSTEEYINYNNTVNVIIEESKEIDFTIL